MSIHTVCVSPEAEPTAPSTKESALDTPPPLKKRMVSPSNSSCATTACESTQALALFELCKYDVLSDYHACYCNFQP